VTAPAPQPQPVYPAGAWPPRRILLVVAAALFVISAFAFGGDDLGDISGYTWLAAGFASWALSGAAP
jgi:hypothetical protein